MNIAAREKIFTALDSSKNHSVINRPAIEKAAVEILSGIEDSRPKLAGEDVVETFIEKVNGPKVGASVQRVSSYAELPSEIAEFLNSKNLPCKISLQPVAKLQELDWRSAGVQCSNAESNVVALGLAGYGIAETGSIVIHSGPHTPILFSFLPEVYIAIVQATNLVMYLEDYAEIALSQNTLLPRTACVITGASGTTDIEGELVIGAHGPGLVHIIVIDST